MSSHPPPSGQHPAPCDPQHSGDPSHVHLFQPGHVVSARRARERGWPVSYVAVCVLCGRTLDLLAGPDGLAAAGHEQA